MEWGIAKGLAQSMDYDKRILDARWQDQQMKRAQDENQAELKAFEDDMDYMNASNSFDHNLIKSEADKTIREIGGIIRDNPDFRYNPDVRRVINEKKKYLKSNQHVIRGLASDEAFKRLNDDLAKVAKNPNMYDAGAYQELLAKKNNYLKYGHQDGEEAAKTYGPQSFVYDKPEDFIDLPTTAIEIGNKYKSDKYKEDGNGGYHQLIDESTLLPLAQNLYNQRKRQFQVQQGVTNDQEGVMAAADMIRAGIKLERKFGEPNHALIAAQWKYRMDQMASQGVNKKLDAYNAHFRDSKASIPGPESITKMIGVAPEVKIYDFDGNPVKTVSGREFVPSGTYRQVPRVGAVTDPKTGKYLGFDKKAGGNIGVIDGYVVYNEDDINETGWLDDPKMSKNIEVRNIPSKWKDGKTEKAYYVKSHHTFDPMNQSYALKFNNAVGETNKQVTEMDPVTNMPKTTVYQNGIAYTYNPITGQYE